MEAQTDWQLFHRQAGQLHILTHGHLLEEQLQQLVVCQQELTSVQLQMLMDVQLQEILL